MIDDCNNTDRLCDRLKREAQTADPRVKILNCRNRCCTTSLCNDRDPNLSYDAMSHFGQDASLNSNLTTTIIIKTTASTGATARRTAHLTTTTTTTTLLASTATTRIATQSTAPLFLFDSTQAITTVTTENANTQATSVTSTISALNVTATSNNNPEHNMVCYKGKINFFTNSTLGTISCKTACLSNEMDVNSEVVGMPISFHQTFVGCAKSLQDCSNNNHTSCADLQNNTHDIFLEDTEMKLINCRSKCCTKSLCNGKDKSISYEVVANHTDRNNGAVLTPKVFEATAMPTTSSETTSNTATETPPSVTIFQNNNEKLITCYTGEIDSINNLPLVTIFCTTACLTNEIRVTTQAAGVPFSFHRTTLMCAENVDDCDNHERLCDSLFFNLQADFASDVNITSCRNKCCTNSLCNGMDKSIAGTVDTSAEVTTTTLAATAVAPTTISKSVELSPSMTTLKSPEAPTMIKYKNGASLTCFMGIIHFANKLPLSKVFCPTTCMTNEMDVNFMVDGKPFSFHQTSVGCSETLYDCSNNKPICDDLQNKIQDDILEATDVKTVNCRNRCCSTSLCNARDPTRNYTVITTHTARVNATETLTTTPSTFLISPNLITTTTSPTQAIMAVTANYNLRIPTACYMGEVNFSFEMPLIEIYCTTACLTNEMDVTTQATGVWFSYHQTSFACAETVEDCSNNERFCDEQLYGLKYSSFEGSNIRISNCRNKCCTTALCNAREPSTTYAVRIGDKTRSIDNDAVTTVSTIVTEATLISTATRLVNTATARQQPNITDRNTK